MARKVFWTDPYLTELDTRVGAVNGDRLTLEETIFYAFSGGQESDHGTIGGQPVLDASMSESEIFYQLQPGHGLSAGVPVRVVIDWDRRYALMRLHFAAEVVLELVTRRLGGDLKVGAHIAADKARIDFAYDSNLSALLPEVANQAMEIVRADRPIRSAFSDEASELRYWEVEGFARVPCGGTHLKRTGEVGDLQLKRKNPGKGKERIEILLRSPAH